MATIENVQKVLINNKTVRFKPDSVKISDTEGIYTTQAKQSGTEIGASNFFNGKRLKKISFELINDEEARRVKDDIIIANGGIVDVSVSTPDQTTYILKAGSNEPIEEQYSSEGDITGFAMIGAGKTTRKIA